jgi:hypothetical protein
MLEWKEREHEEEDAIFGNDPGTVISLRDCGLLKFFRILGMRAQLTLLEYLVHMWDMDQQLFHMGVHTLTLDIKDIYFLIGLSRCGYHASLTGSRGGRLPMSEYCHQYCVPGVERSKGKVSIWGGPRLDPANHIVYYSTHGQECGSIHGSPELLPIRLRVHRATSFQLLEKQDRGAIK